MYNTTGKNFRASFIFGNNTSHQRYSNRVVQIQINEPAFSIMFIPHYDTNKYPFPPFEKNMEYTGEKYYRLDKRRIEGFYEGDIVFFEYSDKKDEYFTMEYEYKSHDNSTVKEHVLVYCLDTEKYNSLIKDLRKNFLNTPDSSKLSINGSWKNEFVMKSEAMVFVVNKINDLKEHLPYKVKKSLEIL